MTSKSVVKFFTSIPAQDADVLFCENFFEEDMELFNILNEEITWEKFMVNMMGRVIPQPRLSCYMGDKSLYYSGFTREPVPWSPVMKEIKEVLNKVVKQLDEKHPELNAVLCNKYIDGNNYIGPHSDDTRDLHKDAYIVSVSLGQTRTFVLQHKRYNETIEVPLTSGSLILMGKGCQENWKHSVPKEKNCGERINLTFRSIK